VSAETPTGSADAPLDEHEAAQSEFSDYVDGELAAPARAKLEQHLAGCAICRDELVSFQSTVAALHGTAHAAPSSVTPSPEFMNSLRAQIRTRSKGRFFGGQRRSYRIEIASLVMLVVAVIIYVTLHLASPMLTAP